MGGFKSIKEPEIVQESRTRKNHGRVVWSHELHQKFLHAIEQLGGNDKAIPKKILAVMNVEGLTRLNVATHLQKYRQCCSTEAQQLNMATRKLPSSEHLPQSPSTNHHSSLSPRVQDVNIRFNQLHLH